MLHRKPIRCALQHAAVGALIALAGCSQRVAAPVSPPPPVSPGPKVALPDGGMRHTERLVQGGWVEAGCWMVCGYKTNRRGASDLKCRQVGAAEAPCTPGTAGAAQPRTVTVDRTAPDRAPGGCRILLEDVPGDPGAPAARASLVGREGTVLLDEWRPAATDDGDYFAIETSFSPDGKWMGVAHVSVGIGDGDRLVRVIDAQVRRAPVCK